MHTRQIKIMVALRKLYKALDSSLDKNLKSLGTTTTDYSILSILNETGPIPMQKLGELILITSGTITYATNRLISIGLIEKLQDSEDKRKFFIGLTDCGTKRLIEINREHLPYLNKTMSTLTNDELDEIRESIKKLGIAVEKNK